MRVAAKLLALALLAAAQPALADPSEADVSFKRARELMKAGNYKAACEQFETSQRLDPQLGTQFNLAQCDVEIGKLATAHALYREVITKDTNAQRRQFAADLDGKLAPRIPKVIIEISGDPSGLFVKLDGREVKPNQPLAMDLGTYELVVTASGRRMVKASVRVTEEARITTVVVPMVSESSSESAEVTLRTEPSGGSAGSSSRKTIGIVTLSVGLAAVATGGVFGALAMSSWGKAKDVCGGMTCMTQVEANKANSLRAQSLDRATLSNVLFVAGGVLATAGIVLWVTAPSGSGEVAVTASATSSGTSVVLSGSF